MNYQLLGPSPDIKSDAHPDPTDCLLRRCFTCFSGIQSQINMCKIASFHSFYIALTNYVTKMR